jgi:predicted site-specific integrase-resolvase
VAASALTRHWSAEEVAALPVVVDLVTAAHALGMGRTSAYEAARRGDFPVPVMRVGRRYRVVTAHLQALLGVTPR